MCILWYLLVIQAMHMDLYFWNAKQNLVVAVASGWGHTGEGLVCLRKETDISQCASPNWNIF